LKKVEDTFKGRTTGRATGKIRKKYIGNSSSLNVVKLEEFAEAFCRQYVNRCY
jgi:hypothetical protein